MTRILLAAAIVLVAAALSAQRPGSSAGGQGKPPVVSETAAPGGTDALDVQWMKVSAPELGTMLAAVARPKGEGPFPALLILHGTHGFAREYVRLAQSMAQHGVIGVAACWFAGGSGIGTRFITPIPCPQAPPMAAPSSPTAQQAVDALVRAVKALPGVRRDRLALFGHSRGAGATLNYVIRQGAVSAAVLNSAGYPADVVGRAPSITVPVLMFHGIADNPADGGSDFTRVEAARTFEAAMHRAGRPVEAKYYQGASHNAIFSDAAQFDDEVRRIAAFLKSRGE